MTDLSDMLVAARANLWRAQERLGVKPSINVVINGTFAFNFEDHASWQTPAINVREPYLKIYIQPAKLQRMLNRELHYNNLEVAGDVMFDRRPNTYMPDVHTLMSFFHV